MRNGGNTAPRAMASKPSLVDSVSKDQSRLSMHFHSWRSVYIAFIASRLIVLFVGFGSELFARVTGMNPDNWRPFLHAETYPHYADVATNGYTLQNAFDYPLLPSILHAFSLIGIPFALTAFVLSNACFLFGLIGMAMIGERYVSKTAAIRGSVYLALMPFAYWFSIASTESLMLALMVGSVLLAMQAKPSAWLAAGALGALAAMTRPPGMLIGLVLLGIAVSQLANRQVGKKAIAAAITAGAMIPAAILGFFVYLKYQTGDALASVHAQDQFNRSVTADGVVRAFTSVTKNIAAGSAGQAIELVATLGASALVVIFFTTAAGQRWEIRGWTLFAAVSLLLPLATGVMWQMPRFALLIPPVFWMLGYLSEKRNWLHYSLLTIFPLALAIKVATAVIGVQG